jgi:ankyrin repeat protein
MKNIFTYAFLFLFIQNTMFAQTNNDSLYQAVVNNDTIAIKQFVQNGANVNFVKQQGWVKINLLITAVNKKNADAVKILLQHGADVNWKDGFQTSALMYAAASGQEQIIKILLDNDADVFAKDEQGNNVLSAAKESKNNRVIELITQAQKKSK